MILPDIYSTRVVFQFDKSVYYIDEIDKFKKNLDNIFCNLNEKRNDICGTFETRIKYISKPYDMSFSDEFLTIKIRFYNAVNDKWTFEELNNFIKTYVKISSEYINTDYIRTFIELEFEH